MARAPRSYNQRRAHQHAWDPTHEADALEAGYYRIRRGIDSVWRPIAIWHGPPLDPITGEELDRSPRWQILFCGKFIWDESLVWPVCKGQPIDRAEYDYLIARIRHAQEHDRRDPYGHPAGKVDWLTSTPPSF